MAPRETENNAYAKFGVTNKEHYGMLKNGIFWSGQLLLVSMGWRCLSRLKFLLFYGYRL